MINGRNQAKRMPRYTLVIPDENLVNYFIEIEDAVAKMLLSEIWKACLAEVDQLPLKAKPNIDTLITIKNPMPKPEWIGNLKDYRKTKRNLNHAMGKHAKTFKFIGIQNIDAILPSECRYFDININLSGQGVIQLWFFLDKLIRLIDEEVPLRRELVPRPFNRSIPNMAHRKKFTSSVDIHKKDPGQRRHHKLGH